MVETRPLPSSGWTSLFLTFNPAALTERVVAVEEAGESVLCEHHEPLGRMAPARSTFYDQYAGLAHLASYFLYLDGQCFELREREPLDVLHLSNHPV